MTELLHRRTFTAKHFDLGVVLNDRGVPVRMERGEFHIGHIHFRDGALKNGEFRDVDTTLELDASTGKWRTTKASYEVEIEPSGAVTFFNIDHFLRFVPPNTFNVSPKPYQGSAFGKLGKALIWENFLQQGGHMIVEARNNALARIFRFEQKPVTNIIPLGIVISDASNFELDGRVVRSAWNVRSKKLSLRKTNYTTYIREPRAWNHRGERVDVEMRFFIDGQGRLLAEKVIPQNFIDRTFNEAGAWLEMDDTSTFFSGSGDGAVFATQQPDFPPQSATDAGTAGTVNSLQLGFLITEEGTLYTVSRLFFPFDTSSLEDNAIINGATFSLFGENKTINQDDSVCIIQTFQASTSSLSVNDWNSVGSTVAATMMVSSWSVTGYNNFSLNSTGLGWIDKTGFTKIGLRSLSDINAEPSGNFSISMYFSEQTGTSQDPKLVVDFVVVPSKIVPKNVLRPAPFKPGLVR
jgi:hypothetical protein